MSQTDMIEFACPSCHAGLRVPAHLAGVSGPCPHCQATISAPHPAPQQPATQPGFPEPAQIPQQGQQQPDPHDPRGEHHPNAGIPEGRPQGEAPKTQPVSSAPNPQVQPSPAEMAAPRQSNARPHKRKLWPSLVFPTIFLALAAATVYLTLDLMGILNFKDRDKGGKSTETLPVSKPATDPQANAPTPEPPIPKPPGPSLPSPTPLSPEPDPPNIPDPILPRELEHNPQDVKKPGEVTGELPDLANVKEDAVPAKNDALKQRMAAISEAREILKRFLSAQTFEERKPFITKSSRTEEELKKTSLSKPFPKSGEPLPGPIMLRNNDRSFETYFSVAFDDAEGGAPNIILIRTVSYSDDEPPKIHIDPFLDLFEETIREFAKEPTSGTKTVHCLIKFSFYCFDDIPRASKMAKVTFYPNTAETSKTLATAYLSRESKPFLTISGKAEAGDFIPCTLSVAWDTETDPKKPFLEVVRLEAFDWTL